MSEKISIKFYKEINEFLKNQRKVISSFINDHQDITQDIEDLLLSLDQNLNTFEKEINKIINE